VPLFSRSKFFSSARLNLDCPSFENEAIQRQFDAVPSHAIGWQSLTSVMSTVTTIADTVSRSVVLVSLLLQQPAMLVFAALHAIPSLFGSRGAYMDLHTTSYIPFTMPFVLF
jgi:hypothetical protein